jgi:tetratricopeptide (TPR) repeat protein
MKITKNKAAKAFLDGKNNLVSNIQYYRTAINLYYETVHWATKIEPIEHRQMMMNKNEPKVKDDDDDDDDDDDKSSPSSSKPSSSPPSCREDTYEQYTELELDNIKSVLYSNSSLCHIQLKNWGYAKNDSNRSLTFNSQNIKSLYRLALSYNMLREYENCGNTIDIGLDIDSTSKDLLRLKKSCQKKIHSARQARQKLELIRSERISKIKLIWKHCQNPNPTQNSNPNTSVGGGGGGGNGSSNKKGSSNNNNSKIIKLGRIALVASTSDELDFNEKELHDDSNDEDASCLESKWHHHFPHTGSTPCPVTIPSIIVDESNTSGNNTNTNTNTNTEWTWPCMFQYPSHNQSDFVKDFNENELLAIRMGDMYPELDDEENSIKETAMKWDYNNEFTCSNLAIYFECNYVTPNNNNNNNKGNNNIIYHPEQVELLNDLSSTMKYYESSRALKGDEGPDIMKVVELVERKRLKKQRNKWKKIYKTLHNKGPYSADNVDCIRIHPCTKLIDILIHSKMIVTNFIVTFIVIPENHPYHKVYLNEHKCIDILQPPSN